MTFNRKKWELVTKLYKEGLKVAEICRLTRFDRRDVRHVCREYDILGCMREPRKNFYRGSNELRKMAVDDIVFNSLSYAEVTVKYNINRTTLKDWVHLFRHGGYEELFVDRRKARKRENGKNSENSRECTDQAEETRRRTLSPPSGECPVKKSESLSRGKTLPGTRDWALAINELRREYRLEVLLDIKKMARSTFYYHIKNKRPDRLVGVRKRIREIHAEHAGRYGYRRITVQLKKEGFVINHKTVYRIMKELGLKNVRRKCKYRSYVGQVGSTASNIVNRDFSTTSPNQKWTTDVTQISVGTEKCYLSPILDMYNGEIVSYVISDRADLKMVMDMLDKACESRVISEGLILHSDQGWQYQHYNYQQSLKQHGIIQSMSRKGNCLDNAMMENFFGIMKSELLYPNRFQNMAHFKQELVKYIDYYNKDRIKLRLNGMSPVQYRTHNAVLS